MLLVRTIATHASHSMFDLATTHSAFAHSGRLLFGTCLSRNLAILCCTGVRPSHRSLLMAGEGIVSALENEKGLLGSSGDLGLIDLANNSSAGSLLLC